MSQFGIDVAANLATVEGRIAAACEAVGRARDEVRLIPVTKSKPAELIHAALSCGYRTFGENKVRELVEKADELGGDSGVRWAAIGHLQTNKARDVARVADEFHALDSLRLAEELDRRLQHLGCGLDVWIQVNSSGESSKSGLAPDDVHDFVEALRPFSALRLRGLMTLALNSDDVSAVGACFVRMQQVQTRLRDRASDLSDWADLSMGMSGDLELAIAHGATTVRVGTAIFGGRG